MKRNNPPKIFIETSVVIRFLTKDDLKKYEDCVALFRQIETGDIRPYTSNIVVMEIVFVLTRLYKFSHNEVYLALQKFLKLRNLTLVEQTDTRQAVELWNKHHIKFGDCMIVAQIPKGVTLVTYDSDFKLFDDIETRSPEQCI